MEQIKKKSQEELKVLAEIEEMRKKKFDDYRTSIAQYKKMIQGHMEVIEKEKEDLAKNKLE